MINNISVVAYRLTSHKETFCDVSRSCYFFQKTLLGTVTHPLFKGTFEDDVPFPQMGYVWFCGGKCGKCLNKRNNYYNVRVTNIMHHPLFNFCL